MVRRLLVLMFVSFSMLVAACEPDTPAERIADSVENVGDEMRESAEDLGNEVEDACEEMKQEAGTQDTNC